MFNFLSNKLKKETRFYRNTEMQGVHNVLQKISQNISFFVCYALFSHCYKVKQVSEHGLYLMTVFMNIVYNKHEVSRKLDFPHNS